MKVTSSVCFVLLCAAGLVAREPTLKEARARWLGGNYAEALDKYRALLKDAKTSVDGAIGVSCCLQSEGEYDKALEAVEEALKDRPRDARLLARQAEVLYLRGRWEAAAKAAD